MFSNGLIIKLLLLATVIHFATAEHDSFLRSTLLNAAKPGIKDVKVQSNILPDSYYDSSEPPNHTREGPVPVNISLTIFDVREIDEKQEHICVDLQLDLVWKDARLLNPSISKVPRSNTRKYTVLTLDYMKQIWHPDIYIRNVKQVDVPEVISKPASLKLHHDGNLRYSSRMTVTIVCKMNFAYYPADTQKCLLDMESYAYKSTQVKLYWDWSTQDDDGLLVSHPAPLPGFTTTIGDERYYHLLQNIDEEGTSGLSLCITLKRRLGSHLLQTYLPSTIYLVVSWLSFILPMESASEKMGYCVACLFTLTTSFSAARQNMPNVHYVRALDVWMVACILFVFLTLVQHAVISKTRRTILKQDEKLQKSSDQKRTIWLPHPDSTMTDDKQEETVFTTNPSPAPGNTEIRAKVVVPPTKVELPDPNTLSRQRFLVLYTILKRTNLHVSLIIPSLFVLFNIIYWSVILSSRG